MTTKMPERYSARPGYDRTTRGKVGPKLNENGVPIRGESKPTQTGCGACATKPCVHPRVR